MTRYTPLTTTHGGIGSIVVCHDANLDRKVAIKYVHGEHRRLLDELSALLRVRSKHVVEVFDVYISSTLQMGIVEEFIEGDELTNYLGKLTPAECLNFLYQIATGLSDIHRIGIIHRDIKPQNILVDSSLILKIVDFNLARPTNDAQTAGFVGTRGYAAPELYNPGNVAFDAKIDIYAFAVVAYRLFTGQPIPASLNSQPPTPALWFAQSGGFKALNLPFGGQFSMMMDSCLHGDPTQRPAAHDVAEVLSSYILNGKHRALFTTDTNQQYELNHANTGIQLRNSSRDCEIVIRYDGHRFYVAAVTGDVYVNNMPVTSGESLPHCCVIALGSDLLPASRRVFVTMDESHPEVGL